MSNESKALELARWLEHRSMSGVKPKDIESAAELRRQHTEIEGLRAQLAARVPEPEHCEPSCLSYDLAAMVMSDCGHSTNNQRLLDRIAERIARHTDAMLSAAPSQQAPAQECEWTNCPRRVGDVCCNEQQAPVAQGEPVGVVDAVSEQGFHVEFSVSLPVGTKLYTHPQQASEPMTDEQIRARCKHDWTFETVRQWVRITEQFHNIKGKQ